MTKQEDDSVGIESFSIAIKIIKLAGEIFSFLRKSNVSTKKIDPLKVDPKENGGNNVDLDFKLDDVLEFQKVYLVPVVRGSARDFDLKIKDVEYFSKSARCLSANIPRDFPGFELLNAYYRNNKAFLWNYFIMLLGKQKTTPLSIGIIVSKHNCSFANRFCFLLACK